MVDTATPAIPVLRHASKIHCKAFSVKRRKTPSAGVPSPSAAAELYKSCDQGNFTSIDSLNQKSGLTRLRGFVQAKTTVVTPP